MTYIVKLVDEYGRNFFEFDTRGEAEEFMNNVTTQHKDMEIPIIEMKFFAEVQ